MVELLTTLVLTCVVIITTAIVMRLIRQPAVIAYILVGVALGPFVFGFFESSATIALLGEIGIILLLFFIGMEISLPKLISNWKVAIIGTFLQVFLSTGVAYFFGYFLSWPWGRSLLIGFGISLSSTAVILKLLEQEGELQSRVGQNALSILLVQDILIVPMLLIVSLLGENTVSVTTMGLQGIGLLLFCVITIYLVKKHTIQLPFLSRFRDDHEIQLFIALLFCFGLSSIAIFFHLSGALGAFIAGMVVAKAKEEKWVHETLHSFRVLFLAIFFISVGLIIDLQFLRENILTVLLLVFTVLVTNTFINAAIFRTLGTSWKEALYTGSLLSQIGEFSFMLAAMGLTVGLIRDLGYQTMVATIALSLLFSPLWISFFKRWKVVS
jgi:monovalent cation:H+ antiporter-2, CPA2 family